MKVLFWNRGIFLLLIAGFLTGCQDDSPPPMVYDPGSVVADRGMILPAGITTMRVLNQGWTAADASSFYSLPQGSHFLDYKIFVNLEQAASTNLFGDPSNILALGYLPRKKGSANKDGLPVGFTQDGNYVGLTCAACHTGYITHGDTVYLIDGGPTLGDGEMFMRGIEQALKAATNDPAKFDRLVTRTHQPPETVRSNLTNAITMRSAYNVRNLPRTNQPRFGPGRIDAFGGILNEVAVRFAEYPHNHTQVDAPVSYPCLWDTPQHDRVQWNGFAANAKSPVTGWLPAVNTPDYGALGRNVGEVIGVFADVETHPGPPFLGGYKSSVNKPNLITLEKTLTKLWSPQWPPEFGKFDTNLQAAGWGLYQKNCRSCHDDTFNRKYKNRTVTAMMSNVLTDPNMASNVANRSGFCGVLSNRYILKVPPQRLEVTNLLGDMLEHIGQRAVLGESMVKTDSSGTNLDAPSIYSVQAIIPLNDGSVLSGAFTQLEFQNHKLISARAARSTMVLRQKDGAQITNIKLSKPPDFERASPLVVRQFSPEPATTDERSLASWRNSTNIAAHRFALVDVERRRTEVINAMKQPNFAISPMDTTAWKKQLANLDFETATITNSLPPLETNVPASTNAIPFLLNFSSQNIAESEVQLPYKARPLNGIWATAPYLHNGSVPNLDELLKESKVRVSQFHVGSHEFDVAHVGLQTNTGDYIFDTTAKFGNSNMGHDHASGTYQKIFTAEERTQLLEYLKSL